MLDVVIGRVSTEATIAQTHSKWLLGHTETIDPRVSRRGIGAAFFGYDDSAAASEFIAWWTDRLSRLAGAGVSGFRCLDIELVQRPVWQRIITAVTQTYPGCRFLAWTPGLDWTVIAALEGVGFSAAFSSVAWWDGRSHWFAEEHELLSAIGSVIGCPQVPFGGQLAPDPLPGIDEQTHLRHLVRRAAATSDGIMVPMGLVLKQAVSGEPGKAFADTPIREANALVDEIAACCVGSEVRMLGGTDRVTAILRTGYSQFADQNAGFVVLINNDLRRTSTVPISLDPLPPTAGDALSACRVISSDRNCSGNAFAHLARYA